jgi:hypothetical protein
MGLSEAEILAHLRSTIRFTSASDSGKGPEPGAPRRGQESQQPNLAQVRVAELYYPKGRKADAESLYHQALEATNHRLSEAQPLMQRSIAILLKSTDSSGH